MKKLMRKPDLLPEVETRTFTDIHEADAYQDEKRAPDSVVRKRRQELEKELRRIKAELVEIRASCRHEDAYVWNFFNPVSKRCPHCGMFL